MSLIPPSPIVMSKMKFKIREKVTDKAKAAEIEALLGPFPIFALEVQFRRLDGRDPAVMYPELPDEAQKQWDCIDTALNMHKKIFNMMKERIQIPGILRVMLQHSLPDEDDWSDMYVDEKPLNISGHPDSL